MKDVNLPFNYLEEEITTFLLVFLFTISNRKKPDIKLGYFLEFVSKNWIAINMFIMW